MSATNRGGERKAYDFYATPPETIRSFLANFDGISSGDRILEPSAGNGQIIKVLRESGYDNRIDAVELRPEERATLEALADNVTMSANDYMSTVTSFSGDADQLADAFATAADNIITATCSDWGCYGLMAALAYLKKDMEILHHEEMESEVMRVAARNGFIDMTGSLLPGIDGFSTRMNVGIVSLMRQCTAYAVRYSHNSDHWFGPVLAKHFFDEN